MEWTSVTFERRGKINRFFFHFIQGINDGFPICCIFRFSLSSALNDGKTFYRKDGYLCEAERRGSIKHKDTMFVPCGIFHKQELKK